MCEFKVFLDGKKIAEDVIYVHVEGRKVTLRDILGEPVEVEGAGIVEVDVPSTKLVLERVS